jgi:hypothetical protein
VFPTLYDVNLPLPDHRQRWRCSGCGNLTRFDVTRTRRTREFWHFDLAGDHVVEDTETLAETLESVTCRWCGRQDSVEVVARADVAGAATADEPNG